MHHQNSPDRVATTLEHLYRHWEEKQHAVSMVQQLAAAPTRFSIAISREAGTPGTAIAQEIGNRLGWHVYDQELMDCIAQDVAVHTRLLNSMDERRGNWLREAFANFLNVPGVSESTYFHRLVKTVLALGSHGECIIVGRGAPFILPVDTTLRVRLVAPLRDRVKALQVRQGISHKDARKQLDAVERERNSFIQNHFSKDPADPHLHDLILNSARFDVAGCAELVLTALGIAQRQREAQGVIQAGG